MNRRCRGTGFPKDKGEKPHMRSLKRRIEKLEDEVAPQRYKEIRIHNYMPGVMADWIGNPGELTIRVRVKRKKRR